MTYFRGETYLKAKMGAEAAAEFKKILDNRSIDAFPTIYTLAHVGRGRGLALTGDTSGARKEYQDFFAAWKDSRFAHWLTPIPSR